MIDRDCRHDGAADESGDGELRLAASSSRSGLRIFAEVALDAPLLAVGKWRA